MARIGSQRIAEWSALSVVVLVLIGVFGWQVEIVQGQAEAAAIKSTLGALRTAFVLEHLRQQVQDDGGHVAPVQRNPFLLLARTPPNYAGDRGNMGTGMVQPGFWMFDPLCNCVGYTPVHSQWVENKNESQTVWFRISQPPGALQLTPAGPYMWRGDILN